MRSILYIQCKECKKDNFILYSIGDTSVKGTCSCGEKFSYSLSSSITIGDRILEKSRYEYVKNEDYSTSIVFSATAFECELSSLYFKWKNVKNNISDQELEKLLRNLGTISKKIQVVSKLMFPEGFNEFVKQEKELCQSAKNDFPSLDADNLVESFQKKLFRPRNRILHFGYSKYNKKIANSCFHIANFGMRILRRMDEYKIISTNNRQQAIPQAVKAALFRR